MPIFSDIAGVLQDVFTIGVNDVLTISIESDKTLITLPNDSDKALIITSADGQTPVCSFDLKNKIFGLPNISAASLGCGDSSDIYFEAAVLSSSLSKHPAVRYSVENLTWQYSNNGQDFHDLLQFGPDSQYSGAAKTAARSDHSHVAGDIINSNSITSVSAAYPLSSTGGATPTLSLPEATIYTAGYMSIDDKTKLNNIEARANNYVHPAEHDPSIITQNYLNRFVSDSQILMWDSKENVLTFTTGLTRDNNNVINDLLVGVNGGQQIVGGRGSSDNLTLISTSSAIKGFIVCEDDLKAKSLISGKIDEMIVDGGVVVDGLLVKDGCAKFRDPGIDSPTEADAGKLRYYKNDSMSCCDMVMQIDETTFKWVNLFTNNW